MRVLLVSEDPRSRESMALVMRSLQRTIGEPVEFLEASDGLRGIRAAWRFRPELVVADEFASRAGAFALTKELKGADPPFTGAVVIWLDRPHDAWLASWAGADAWFVKPVNPFDVADRTAEILRPKRREAV